MLVSYPNWLLYSQTTLILNVETTFPRDNLPSVSHTFIPDVPPRSTEVPGTRWAHTRSLIGLTANLLRANPELHITILIEATRAGAAEAEYAQYGPENLGRMVVVHYGEPEEGEHPMINPPGAGTFLKTVPQALTPFLEPICEVGPVLILFRLRLGGAGCG